MGASSTPSLARWVRENSSQLVSITFQILIRSKCLEVEVEHLSPVKRELCPNVEVSPVPVLPVGSLEQIVLRHSVSLQQNSLQNIGENDQTELSLENLENLSQLP